MPNITVDQQKLVLNAFAATFQNNLLSKDLVTWRQYDTEMDDRNGLKVAEQVGPRYVITRTTNGVANLTGGTQDSVFGSEQFVVNQTFGASMGWADFVKIQSIGDARESEALMNAATNLAEQIDAYTLQTAAQAANNEVGTVGNNVATFADVSQAYVRLKKEGVEDSDLRMVLAYDDMQALGSSVIALTAPDAMVTSTFRKGFDGTVAGIPTMFTQQLSNITTGTRNAAGTVNGANQNVNYSAVAVSGAPGQYMTQTINLTGAGAAATVNDGEIFTIANVYAYDNRLQQQHIHLQEFRVIGNYTADGSGNLANVRIFPAIIVPGTGSGGDINVNSAFGTCNSVPAASAVVTFRGAASLTYKPRAVIQKQAIIMNTADLILPATGIGTRKQLTQVPLSVRMWQNSTFETGLHNVRFDVALTANVRDRRRVCRLNGN